MYVLTFHWGFFYSRVSIIKAKEINRSTKNICPLLLLLLWGFCSLYFCLLHPSIFTFVSPFFPWPQHSNRVFYLFIFRFCTFLFSLKVQNFWIDFVIVLDNFYLNHYFLSVICTFNHLITFIRQLFLFLFIIISFYSIFINLVAVFVTYSTCSYLLMYYIICTVLYYIY